MARPREFNEEHALDQAVDAFWKNGFDATSLDDLLRQMNIPKQSLYNTFGDKRSLFLRCLVKYQQARMAETKARFENARSVEEAFRLHFERITNATPEGKKQGCLAINAAVELAPHDPEVAQIVAANQQFMQDVFADAIERGMRTGELPNTLKPRRLARFLHGTAWGMWVYCKASPYRDYPDDLMGEVMRALGVESPETDRC